MFATLFFIGLLYFLLNALGELKPFHHTQNTHEDAINKIEILLSSPGGKEKEEGERLLLEMAKGESDEAKLRLARLYWSEPLLAKKWLLKVNNAAMAQPLIEEIDKAVSQNHFTLEMVTDLAHSCDPELVHRNRESINKAEAAAIVLMRYFCPAIYPEKSDIKMAFEDLSREGNELGLFYLGKLYLDGIETAYDPVKGKSYLELACKKGVKKACDLISESLSGTGEGINIKEGTMRELKQIEKQLRHLAE